MKLWLDDERDPSTEHSKMQFGSNGDEIWVKDIKSTIEYLQTGKVTEISLDHDLGREETGMAVAKWIEEQAYLENLPKLRWNIHSMNVIGRKNMTMALMNADKYWNK